MSNLQQRGPAARKIELERRLDANADIADAGSELQAGAATPHQQGTQRGAKAQLATPHRPGRPGGGNIRREIDREIVDE